MEPATDDAARHPSLTDEVTFARLAEPVRLRHLTLRNRIVFGAHTANMSELGLPAAAHLGYYRERARGGAAMIVVEPVPVHPTAVLTRGNFRPADDAVIPGFRAITDAVHAEGAAILHQLYHVGQHGDADNSHLPAWSPSGMPSYHDPEGSHRMTGAEVEEIIESFVAAAVRAQRSGFDGVEIFAAYHSLVDQFWLEWSNRRTDDWGGSFERRMRFSAEILGRIRATVGDDFVIGLAVSLDERAEVAMSADELCAIVAWHDERRLMDYVTCGTGSYFTSSDIIPDFQRPQRLGVPAAARLKQVVRHALVQAESHVRTPAQAEQVLADGHADMVSIVRGQIADPYLVDKALTGRASEIRGCISCNQQCWGRRARDYWISCLVNPSVGREWQWGGDRFERAAAPKQVLVVGGGPAGLEAARVAAERGHRVSLVEAGAQLGGAFRLAGLQPDRGQITDLLAWYERELERLDVAVSTGRPMSASDIAAAVAGGVQHVIVATGAEPDRSGFQRALPLQPRLPGTERDDVWTVEQVLAGDAVLGQRVVVLDDAGDWRGCGTARHLAERGHQVTIVCPHATVGAWLARTFSDRDLRRTLAAAGVRWHTESAMVAWGDDGAVVRSLLDGTMHTVAAESLVLATGKHARDEIIDELEHRRELDGSVGITAVGDVLAPRLASTAIHEGRLAGMEV